MKRWRGEVALVTGASSGIGAAVVHRLLESGLRVAALARRQERLLALAETYGTDRVLPLTADLRREDDILAAFTQLDDRWGPPRVLVNNAGLGRSAPLLSGPSEAWREMLEVNVLALAICTREAVRRMREASDRGHVFHISSMAAHRVPPGSGVYSATKFAVRSLTEGLRQELRTAGSRIRVTAISPGFVETEFASVFHGRPEASEETYGQFKVLEAVDVADALLHALSAPPHVQIHDILLRPTEQPG